MARRLRIGMVGYGYIGRSLYEALAGSQIDVVNVYDEVGSNVADLPASIVCSSADEFVGRATGLDLVVEVAHPVVAAQIGVRILSRTSFMPCSVVALADEDLGRRLLAAAKDAGTRLYIPHGAVIGMDNMIEAREHWTSVSITFRKPPASIDAAAEAQGEETLLFEGSAREIARKFPRSVNAMVACALVTVGLDVTRTRMFADRRFGNVLRGEFELTAKNGARMTIIKEEPGVGVSGVGMVNSIKGSIFRALGVTADGPIFV
jgi:aspartate dehydrogenase